MNFRVEPTNLLDRSQRYGVVNDFDATVAVCEYRSWAEIIASLLNASGTNHDPTAEEDAQERARDIELRQARDIEEFGEPEPSPEAEAFRAAAKRYMEGGEP